MTPNARNIRDWNEVLDESSYYEILGVLEIADEAAIKAAFHAFAEAFHPDAHREADPATLDAVKRVFQRGAEAYRVLSHPELRPRYDLGLAKGILRLESKDVPNRAALGKPARSLEDLCITAAARLFARKAEQLIGKGDLSGAKRELVTALSQDGGKNPELAARIEALDLALFAMGE